MQCIFRFFAQLNETARDTQKNPRFRGENALAMRHLMHCIGSSPPREHGSHSRHTHSQDVTNVSPVPLPRAITAQSTRS